MARIMRIYSEALGAFLALAIVVLACLLFVPPLRDKFFVTSLWPWTLGTEARLQQIEKIRSLSRPGDVIVEANMHFWQWEALCKLATGSSWVHTALIDESKDILTVDQKVVRAPMTVYLKWRSTRLALVRPPYKSSGDAEKAIQWAQSKLGTPYDPSFANPAGSCTGLVGRALEEGGVKVQRKHVLGGWVYGANSFLEIPGARILWRSDR